MVQELTLAENITEELEKGETVRVKATVEDYFDIMQDCDFDLEFDNNTLIASMSIATEIHELLVANIIGVFFREYGIIKGHRVYGSNRPVYVPECNRGFNADVLVVKGKTELFPRQRTVAATLNPHIMVEVLSESNRSEGFSSEKLACYRKIESLKQIILVSQKRPHFEVYTKNEADNTWTLRDFEDLSKPVELLDFNVNLSEIYLNVYEE